MAVPMRIAEPERTVPVVGAALTIAAVGIATILGYFEYVLHYRPCPPCREQRIPYYVGISLALALAVKFNAGRASDRAELWIIKRQTGYSPPPCQDLKMFGASAPRPRRARAWSKASIAASMIGSECTADTHP
jgi:hypothetical protein